MRIGSALFLLGILALASLPDLPPLRLLWLSPLCIGLWSSHCYLRWPAWFLAGALYALYRGGEILSVSLDPGLEGATQTVIGRVASLPEQKGPVRRFNFRLESGVPQGLPAGTLVRLGWYHDAPTLVPGERWRLRVRLKRPVGFMNPGSFDYEGWLFQHRLRATGYVSTGSVNSRLEPAGPWRPDAWRFRLRERIHAALPDGAFRPLVVALALGDQSAIPAHAWTLLNRTGTNHLLAISGLHIGLVAALALVVVRWGWPRLGRAALFLPGPWAGAAAGLLAALFYSALAGFSIPTQRSLIMILVGLGATVCRPVGLSHALALALLLVLFLDPFAVLAPGFWLSFLAVAWIGWGMHGRVGTETVWDRWGRVQVVVSLGLTPALACWFQQISVAGVVANLLAIPWVSFVTVPLVLAGSLFLFVAPVLGTGLLRLADGSLALLWPFLDLIGGSDAAMLPVAPVTFVAAICAGLGAAILLLPRGVPGRWLGWFWVLPLLAPNTMQPATGVLRLAVLDVGQGLSAVVRTGGHALLFDTGPRFSPDFNAGEAVVVPWLRQAGIKELDVLVLSHGDNDHSGGLDSVLDEVSVARILTSVPERVRGGNVTACRSGLRWHWDGFGFSVLHPGGDAQWLGNNASCVLRIARGGQGILLLTGDIEREAELDLVRHHATELRAGIIVVPHHGSRTSSTPDLVQAVRPRYAIHPAGFRNRFGFPKQDIMQRYQLHGAINLDTGRNGALEFVIDETGVRFSAHRVSARRFWHTRLQ